MDGLFKGFWVGCLFSVCSLSQAACPMAEPVTSAGFCESFKASTECFCMESYPHRGICMNMSLVYKIMIDTRGTLQRACELKHVVPTQECMDDWNCFRYGGVTSTGELCSGTGNACA